MKTIKTFLISAIISCIYLISANAADVAKIAVVDIQRIVALSSYGKLAQAEINKKGETLMGDLKGKEKELTDLKNELERKGLVMSPEKRDEKEREFRIKLNDIKVVKKKYEKELGELNMRLVGRIQDDVIGLVQELGKKEGYLLIIEKREAGVMYSPETIDISDRVTGLYNEKYAKEKAKAAE
jgi:outer membrane protein